MERVEIIPEEYTIGDRLITEMMRTVLDALNGDTSSSSPHAFVLREGIINASFRAAVDRTSSNAALVTLIYRRPIEEGVWSTAARALRDALRAATGVSVNVRLCCNVCVCSSFVI